MPDGDLDVKADDLNKRRKLLPLLLRSVRIRRLRPSFAAEGGLIVCRVQDAYSFTASRKVPGVFVEVLEPERVEDGEECAGYRDSGLRFVRGHGWPTFVYHLLRITRAGYGYRLKAWSRVSRVESKLSEDFESYAEVRAGAISWLRGEVLSAEERESSGEGKVEPISFSPAREGIALRWLPDEDRRRVVGESVSDPGEGAETGAGGRRRPRERAGAGYLED